MDSCVMTIRSVACACSAKIARMASAPSLARQEFARPNASMPDSEITRAPSAYRHPPRLTGDGRQADSQCIQSASARQRWPLSSTRARRRPSTKIQAAIGLFVVARGYAPPALALAEAIFRIPHRCAPGTVPSGTGETPGSRRHDSPWALRHQLGVRGAGAPSPVGDQAGP